MPVQCAPSLPRCRGTVVLRAVGRHRRGDVLGRARFSVASGHTARVRMRLTRAARRALARHGRLPARIVASGGSVRVMLVAHARAHRRGRA